MKPEDQEIWNVVFTKDENIVARKIADEMLLVPIRGNLADMQRIFALNPVGEFIWNHLDGKNTVNNIRDTLLEEVDVEQTEAETDIVAFLNELQGMDLLVPPKGNE